MNGGAVYSGPAGTVPVWKVDPVHFDPEMLDEAASVLRGGGVLIYPTETLYGLGGKPVQNVVDRVYRIKGRTASKPLPLVAEDMDAVRAAVALWPSSAEKLAKKFWPGPLSLLLHAAPHLPPSLHGRTGRIAVRISPHPVARALSSAAGGLLISTSANPAGQPPSHDPDGISGELISKVDGMVDAGLLPGGPPSTIVDVTVVPPRIVRTGCVPVERVMEVITR